MRIVHAALNEFLVVSRGGRPRNLGLGASALLMPGTASVTVRSTKEEAPFALTQESSDGIPLRFKGMAIYRVVDPVAAAAAFDFVGGQGHEQIQRLVGHICMGELRDVVSKMPMKACIEERKTTLTQAVEQALSRVIARAAEENEGRGWGVELDIVQVAQVFIVDDELRVKLEAELRSEVQARSQQAEIAMREAVELARADSRQRLEQRKLEEERDRTRVEAEKAELARALDQTRLEAALPVEQLRLRQRREVLELAIEVRRLENLLHELEVEGETALERKKLALEREVLPLRQVPQIAEALCGMFEGANVSLYGADNALMSSLEPILDLLSDRLRGACAPATAKP